MKMLMRLISLYLACLSFTCYAQDDVNHTLHLYIQNKSNENLEFLRIVSANPGNIFKIQPLIIKPGEIMHIEVKKTLHNDVSGYLIFKNSHQAQAHLFILDQEQIHIGQPVFDISGAVNSTIITKKRNENIGPRYLSYIKVVLQI